MATNALKRAPVAGIAIPIVTLTLAGIAIAAQAVEDNALALLYDGFAFVFALSLDRHLCCRLAVRRY